MQIPARQPAAKQKGQAGGEENGRMCVSMRQDAEGGEKGREDAGASQPLSNHRNRENRLGRSEEEKKKERKRTREQKGKDQKKLVLRRRSAGIE